MTATILYRWAHPDRLHGMASVEECLADGYTVVGADPRYPDTLLMRREVRAHDE